MTVNESRAERRNRPTVALGVVGAVAAFVAVVVGAAWVARLGPFDAGPALTSRDAYLARIYNGEYGGLTVDHGFGEGRLHRNPPDIIEAGGYFEDVTWTEDGRPNSFTLRTVQGKKFEFLVRPETVPVNWRDNMFEIYNSCQGCFVAIHFTKQPEGNVAIVLFPVEDNKSD